VRVYPKGLEGVSKGGEEARVRRIRARRMRMRIRTKRKRKMMRRGVGMRKWGRMQKLTRRLVVFEKTMDNVCIS